MPLLISENNLSENEGRGGVPAFLEPWDEPHPKHDGYQPMEAMNAAAAAVLKIMPDRRTFRMDRPKSILLRKRAGNGSSRSAA